MLKRINIIFNILTIGLLSLSCQSKAETIKIVTGDNFKPFTDKKLEDGGMATKIMKAVFKNMKVDLKIDVLPWKRGFELTKGKIYASTYPYLKTPDREKDFLFSVPIYQTRVALFSLVENPIEVISKEHMSGKVYCNPLGYSTIDVIERYKQESIIKNKKGTDLDACFHMLNRKHVDFVPISTKVGNYIITKIGYKLSDFDRKYTDQKTDNYMIVSKKYPKSQELIDRFNKSFKELDSKGKIEKIIQEY